MFASKGKRRGVVDEGYHIRFTPDEFRHGFDLLLHHGQVGVLPNKVYVVSQEHLDLLDEAKISYEILKK